MYSFKVYRYVLLGLQVFFTVYTPAFMSRVYSFRLSICLFICSFVCLFILPSRSWNYFKVLHSSNSSGVYLSNHSSESIHIWTIGTLEGRLSFHDSSPQGPCPGVGLIHVISPYILHIFEKISQQKFQNFLLHHTSPYLEFQVSLPKFDNFLLCLIILPI